MSNRNLHCFIISILLACMLNACGGGGGSGEGPSGGGSGVSGLVFPLNVVVANARFLLFPNPQRQVSGPSLVGTDETNTSQYANAYYQAIDVGNNRDTLTKWMSTNGFIVDGNGVPIDDDSTQVTVVFGDKNDLGYGRRMTARKNADNSLAFMVENYLVNIGSSGGYVYSSLNADAAVVRSQQRFVSVSAIEYGDLNGPLAPDNTKFVKFYVFGPDGVRKPMVDQDGLGAKAMPNICVNCHGGRADPLTSTNTFPVVGNAASQQAGDTTSRLQSLKVHTFDFSASVDPLTGLPRNRALQEEKLRLINQWVRDSYSNTGINEWDGQKAQALIQTAYGNPLSTTLVGNYQDSDAQLFVPDATWASGGQPSLYPSTVGPVCMTCHILRGTKNIPDQSFTTFAQFTDYSDRIKAHVFDRGNMPLAKIVFEDFWGTSTRPSAISQFLDSRLSPNLFPADKDGGGAPLKPGRPIADPGPDRFIRPGSILLTANNSLYANSYIWSIISQNGISPATNAMLSNPASATPTFTANANAAYVVRLTVAGNGISHSKDFTILVDSVNAPDPAGLNFTAIKAVLADPVPGCQAGCHQGNLTVAERPPLSYDQNDYPGTGVAQELAFYKTVKGRINFADVVASPLLRKPSGHHHKGDLRTGFNSTLPVGSLNRRNYDLFVEWIMAGAPQ